MLFFATARIAGATSAVGVLVLASLFFYGWWNPLYVPLILASVLVNFFLGRQMAKQQQQTLRKILLWLGLGFNLLLLGYFKYANFFVDSVQTLSGAQFNWTDVVLPIAISFFTFQQIAYLVDVYKNKAKEYRFVHYCLFITFFPQLIAGPVVHHRDILPQFLQPHVYRFSTKHFALGLTLFAMGLFKKTVFADSIAVYASPIFVAADSGDVLTFIESWGGLMAYSFQIYFDFSGYSDMAMGLAMMIGIMLPVNFNSPYKAANFVELWRRWHITVSQFLRDYIYIPLGGSRRGKVRRYNNLMITMVLGGLWHGAGVGFIVWGFLMGSYLCINSAWGYWCSRLGFAPKAGWYHKGCVLLTFLVWTASWPFFNAATLDGTMALYQGLSGFNGIVLPQGYSAWLSPLLAIANPLDITFGKVQHFAGSVQIAGLIFLAVVVWTMPNSNELIRRLSVMSKRRGQARWLALYGLLGGFALAMGLMGISEFNEFIYFRF